MFHDTYDSDSSNPQKAKPSTTFDDIEPDIAFELTNTSKGDQKDNDPLGELNTLIADGLFNVGLQLTTTTDYYGSNTRANFSTKNRKP